MKTRSIVALLAVVVACSACQTISPTTQVAKARQVYTAAVRTMTDLANSGNLSADTAEKFEAARAKVASLLDAADASVASGADFKVDTLTSAITTLQQVVALALKAVTHG